MGSSARVGGPGDVSGTHARCGGCFGSEEAMEQEDGLWGLSGAGGHGTEASGLEAEEAEARGGAAGAQDFRGRGFCRSRQGAAWEVTG